MCRTVQDVKRDHADELMRLPGVVSVGIGLDAGTPAIVVGLAREDPELEKRLPHLLEGYRVVVRTVGTIEAH